MKKLTSILAVVVTIVAISKVSAESRITLDEKVETTYENSFLNFPSNQTTLDIEESLTDPPLITDPPGDYQPAGLDFINLYVSNDETNVYFLYEFSGKPENCIYLMIDSDQNPATGCRAFGMGFEYGITFCPGWDMGYIGDARDCGWGDGDFSGALKWMSTDRYILAAVPIKILQIITPVVKKFDITTANDTSYIIGYSTKEPIISGCVKMEGIPLAGREVILKQLDAPNQRRTTDANGCYGFPGAVSGRRFRVIIRGPAIP